MEYWNNSASTNQRYSPKITVLDAGGCIAEKILKNQIQVYNYPEISETILPDTLICQREKIFIRDTGVQFRYFYSFENCVGTKSIFCCDKLNSIDPGIL